MSNQCSIMVVGYYGAGNAGDELLLKLILNSLPQGVKAIVLSVNPAHTERLHQTQSVSLFKMDQVFEHMLSCQLLILGGGGLMQTSDRFTQEGLLRFDASEVSAYVRPFLMAKQLGVRTMVWAQGVGPLETLDAKRIAKNVFDTADLVSIRDVESLKLLKHCGVVRDVLVAPDPVWTMAASMPRRRFTEQHNSKKNLVITLRPWALHNQDWKKSLATAIDQCVDPSLFRITWLPFLVTPSDLNSEYVQAEKQVIEDIQLFLSSKFDQEIVIAHSFDELFASAALADYAICMRLHAQILHHLRSTPVISIQYDKKLEYMATQIDHPEALCVSLSSTPHNWINALKILLTTEQEQLTNTEKTKACIASAAEQIEFLKSGFDDVNASQNESIAPIDQVNFDWFKAWLVHQPEIQASIAQNILDKSLLEIDRLKQEIDQQLKREEEQRLTLQFLKSSWSWRTTRPLRFFQQFFQSPKRAIYLASKAMYWQLSPQRRSQLAPIRDPLLRMLRGSSNRAKSVAHANDMNWGVFSTQILANRQQFKGVFIQECVIDWAVPLYQRPQHIAAAMGRLNYLVIYRTNNWSDDNVHGFRLVAPNVWLSNCEEVDTIEDALRSVYSTAVVDQRRLKQFPANTSIVYEYIDHIDPEISGDSENIRRLTDQKTRMLSGDAQFVIASASKLSKDISRQFDVSKVFLIPNGVDVAHYRYQSESGKSLPNEYTNFCENFKICVGYFGAVAPWLDYPLINELVRLRPDVGFVFIGPDYFGGQASINTRANVLLTGAIPYAQLPRYAARFDVCWIPFKPGEIAKSTSPLKLFEYFALEKPVMVTTDMLECTAYPEVLHGQTSDIMSEHIDFAVSRKKDDLEFRMRLRQLADENDWNHRAGAYADAYESMRKR